MNQPVRYRIPGDRRPVYIFDLTLVWPIRLTLERDRNQNVQEVASKALEDHAWVSKDPLTRDGDLSEAGYAAAELAFFHTFVQQLLFGNVETGQRPFRLYHYAGLKPDATLKVVDRNWQDIINLKNLWFYLMDDGSAMVVIQLSAPEQTDWARVLNAISYLRTVHFQHYKLDDAGHWIGGGAPDHVEAGPFKTAEAPEDRGTELDIVIKRRRPEFLDHWRSLLDPLFHRGIVIDAIGDYRMAAMAFIGTPEPETLTDDEWFALAEADAARFAEYAPKFREERISAATYDRWWSNDAGGKFRDRWVAGPLTLARVVAVGPNPPGHIERVRKSWSRQYFQIFFLAHFQRAALMILQTRVAEATALLPRSTLGRPPGELRTKLEEIDRDMAIFSSRFWFTEVSPQAQGQDLFALLQKRIGSDALYRGVKEDKSLLGDWVRTRYWNWVNTLLLPSGMWLAALGVIAAVGGLLADQRWKDETFWYVLALFGIWIAWLVRLWFRRERH